MGQHQDYILRLIEQLGAMIRAALVSLGSKDAEERPELAGEAIGLALSMDAATASSLTPETLVALLELGEVDTRVIALLREALEAEVTALEDRGDLTTAILRRDQAQAVGSLLEAGAGVSPSGASDASDVSYMA